MLSDCASPDLPQLWQEVPPPLPVKDDEDASDHDKTSNAVDVQDVGAKYSTLSLVIRQQEADEAENEELFSLRLIPQAIHALTEAISIAVASKQWVSVNLTQIFNFIIVCNRN